MHRLNRTQLPCPLYTGAVGIAAGGSHTCAVTTSGAVYCWGYNYDGQLGTGDTTSRYTPTAVSGLAGMLCITALLKESAIRCDPMLSHSYRSTYVS